MKIKRLSHRKLGFVITGKMQNDGDIQYIPMEYRMEINANCPCSKTKCIRHGR